jgi:uncharacterized protein YecE (DUF72 family)/DNA-binding XRE family transcriptional regulator
MNKMGWNAERIKALRCYLKLTQQELAHELGTRQQTISEWESGIYKPRGSSVKLLTIVAERAGFEYRATSLKDNNVLRQSFKVGCCGFARGRNQYFTQFELVEVQQSFYKPPRADTALRWRKEAPSDFEFTLKAWQLITHSPSSPTYRKAGIDISQGEEKCYGFFKPTEEVMAAWLKTKEIAKALGAKIVVFQCPPSFSESRENKENIRSFFHSIDREGLLFAWELRGNWSDEGIISLCQELDLLHCVDPFLNRSLSGTPHYFRLHGGPRYLHTYSDEELKQLAQMGQKGGYFLFNNISMYDDALRFKRLLAER